MRTHSQSSGQPLKQHGETQRVLDAIRKIVQLLRESARTTEHGLGITPAQLFALQRMPREGAVSVNELAARTFTHQSSVSVVVKRLVERKLVNSAPSPTDGRRVALSLTDSGKKLLEEAPDSVQGRVVRGLEKLGVEDREHLAGLLDRLLVAMDVDMDAPAAMLYEDAPRPGKL